MEGNVQDDYQKLQAAIPHLSEKDKEFAQNLMEWIETKGGWSPNQEKWVKILIEKAEPKPEAVKVGQIDGIIELFVKAKQHLKYPAIVLTAADNGAEIRVKPAPATGSNPGCIYVHYETQYAGKITPGGEWVPLKSVNANGFIYSMLKMLAADPAGVASAQGKMTGKCCFCNSKLTDPKSTSVGYGPVCAQHYGLPHGPVIVGTPEASDVIKEMTQISTNELAGEMIAEVVAEVVAEDNFTDHLLDTEKLCDDLEAAGLTVLTEVPEPIPFEEAAEIEKEFIRERVEFDCVPGKAVKNLLEALSGSD
jgi:hypothetical protein